MNHEFDILSFAGLSGDSTWTLDKPVVTEFRIVFTEDSFTPEEIAKAIANFAEEPIDVEWVEETPWAIRLRVPSLPTDFILWEEELSEEIKSKQEVASGSMLAMQTKLHPADPLTHFTNLMRLFGSLPFGVHSICDVPTGRWYPKHVIEDLFFQDVDAPEEVLWLTRLIEAPEDVEPEERWAWISTHGLERCGKVELEMLSVPAVLSTEGVHCVDGLAALTLEQDLPQVGQSFTIGHGLNLSLIEVPEALKMLGDDMPGREERPFRSAVVTSENHSLLCPLQTLELLRSSKTAIAKTSRSTNRRRSLAHQNWDAFLQVAKSVGQGDHAACMVQVPWANNEEENAPREYLWFTVDNVNEQNIETTLAHQPYVVDTLNEGHQESFVRDDITDWVVLTPVGPLGPSDMESIELFTEQIRS